jgi:hypothetical protein
MLRVLAERVGIRILIRQNFLQHWKKHYLAYTSLNRLGPPWRRDFTSIDGKTKIAKMVVRVVSHVTAEALCGRSKKNRIGS